MAEEKSKKKWQPKRADWKAGGAEEGSDDLREKRMAEVEALTVEGKARKEAEAKVVSQSWYISMYRYFSSGRIVFIG
jgi:hypothetical protein